MLFQGNAETIKTPVLLINMKYIYENLSSGQFEELVRAICRRLFGPGVQAFSEGPDGGRDAKFIGTASVFPSVNSPWSGTTIIQAKHTNGYNKKFSDSAFFGEKSETCAVGLEIPRIAKLTNAGKLDNYILFANRNLSAIVSEKIVDRISDETQVAVASVYLCGREQLESWLKDYPDIPDSVALDSVDSPLIVSPDDLAVIIEEINEVLGKLRPSKDSPPVPRTSYQDKNKINDMDDAYAKEMRRRYLKYTPIIDQFLSEPENEHVLQKYNAVIEDFQLKIISKRKEYQSFEEVLEYLADLLFDRDIDLSRNKKLTRTMLFYMYWNCDIGENDA